MTWVVGMSTPFGYGAGISDIRVTLSNGDERDCLQKIYPIGRFLALGFAGSVAIGFGIVNKLTELLYTSDESGVWDPEAVAEWLPQDAREVFSGFPEEERRLQSHLMLIAVHPNKHLGNLSWPRSYVYRFRSPNFEPCCANLREVVGIGCGSDFQPFRDTLATISTDHHAMFQIMQGETNNPGGMAQTLGIHLTSLLKDIQPRGVSSHLHFCWVYRGRIVIKANDHVSIGRWSLFEIGINSSGKSNETDEHPNQAGHDHDGPARQDFTTPQIATSLDQFESLLRASGASAAGALA